MSVEDSNSESLQWPQWPQRSAPLDARDAEAAFSIRSYAEEVLDRCSSSPVQRHPNRPTSSFLEEMQRRGHGDSRSVSPVGMPAPRTPERGSIPPGSRPTIDSPQMIKIDGAIAVARSLLSPKVVPGKGERANSIETAHPPMPCFHETHTHTRSVLLNISIAWRRSRPNCFARNRGQMWAEFDRELGPNLARLQNGHHGQRHQ